MIYGIHKTTKEHIVWPDAGSAFRALVAMDGQWSTVQADADGWIEWEGSTSQRPVSDFQKYEAQTRDGRFVSSVHRWLNCPRLGQKLDSDIIAYRPIFTKPAKSKAWAGVESDLNVGDVVFVECPPVETGKAQVVGFHQGKVIVWTYSEMEYRGFAPEFVKPIPTEREQWIEAAKSSFDFISDNVAPVSNNDLDKIYGALYDAGLTKLPTPEKK